LGVSRQLAEQHAQVREIQARAPRRRPL